MMPVEAELLLWLEESCSMDGESILKLLVRLRPRFSTSVEGESLGFTSRVRGEPGRTPTPAGFG